MPLSPQPLIIAIWSPMRRSFANSFTCSGTTSTATVWSRRHSASPACIWSTLLTSTIENVARYCINEAVETLAKCFPARGLDYHIAVTIQETDNNYFTLERRVAI